MTSMPLWADEDRNPDGYRGAWPYDVHPTGWFQVAWSADIPPDQLLSLRAFDLDLVAFRDPAGEVRVLDAYCPHLGASLAHGGTIVDGNIVCPFHGWEWSADGRNVRIPYSTTVNRAQRIRTWPTREIDSLVYMWHGPAPLSPTWDLMAVDQAIETAGFTNPFRGRPPDDCRTWKEARLYPQFITENLVDHAHFHWVHSARGPTDLHEYKSDGPFFQVHHRLPGQGDTRLMILASGVGVQLGVFSRRGVLGHVEITTATPVNGGRSTLRTSVWSTDTGSVLRELAEMQSVEFSKDVVIWENMRYIDRPPLVPEEARAFRALRRWAAQFYDGDIAK
jgi:phenylpropionate dioxygenase-like ring-hydroxylating dioxygenase large terminal subunit